MNSCTFYVRCSNSIYWDGIFLNHSTLRQFFDLVSVMYSSPFLTAMT